VVELLRGHRGLWARIRRKGRASHGGHRGHGGGFGLVDIARPSGKINESRATGYLDRRKKPSVRISALKPPRPFRAFSAPEANAASIQ
jgi:hypothetical protein